MDTISRRIANMLVHNSIADEQEKAVVAYGLEVSFYKAIHLCIAVLIGAMFGRIFDILVFHLFYQKLRTYAGGYHAKTNLRCFICSCVITVTVLSFWLICPQGYHMVLTIVFLIVSIPVIWILSPVEAAEKPLDEIEQTLYRKRSRIFFIIESFIILILLILGVYEIALVGSTALVLLAVMLVIGSI